MKTEKDFVTVKEVSVRYGKTIQQVYYLIKKNIIESKKIFNRFVIPIKEIKKLDEYVTVKQTMLTPKQHCEKYGIKRGLFNYRMMTGIIKTIKINGRRFVEEPKPFTAEPEAPKTEKIEVLNGMQITMEGEKENEI